MLAKLTIQNIAVISQVEIDLTRGLNIFTGETGAGKTILISAINLILGQRAAKELIRSGERKASVTATFTDISPEIIGQIRSLGFDCDEYTPFIIAREIEQEGKGRCRIGRKPVNLSVLKQVSSLLITIHGQQDNQELFDPDAHLTYIDRYGDLSPLLKRYREVYGRLNKVATELERNNISEQLKEQKIDMLSFQINELEAAGLIPGEEEELRARRKMMQNAQKINESLSFGLGTLRLSEDAPGILSQMSDLIGEIRTLDEFVEELEGQADRLQEMVYELEELERILDLALGGEEYDPRELDHIEERLDLLYRLKKKYGDTVEDMIGFLDTARAELKSLTLNEERLGELKEEYETLKTEAEELAEQLSGKRLSVADRFIQEIQNELMFLDMQGVQIQVQRRQKPLGSTGWDEIEFYMSTNRGEELRPLSKIASGGEVARVMLAIKNVLAERDEMPTLIFDEIDTGVSGRAAGKIGKKLREVSGHRQVICITHLAQVAAFAKRHLFIEKKVLSDNRTHTQVMRLNNQGRIQELARIISGDQVTDLSLENAREMLFMAQQQT